MQWCDWGQSANLSPERSLVSGGCGLRSGRGSTAGRIPRCWGEGRGGEGRGGEGEGRGG